MAKQKNKENSTGDHKEKTMLLKVDALAHAKIKSIAESTSMTQPNVVNLILSDVLSKHSDTYIAQIQKIHARETLKKLDAVAAENEAKREQLKKILEETE